MSEFSTKGAALMMQQQGRNDGVGLPTLTLPDPAAGGGGRSRRSMRRRAARQQRRWGSVVYQRWRQSLSEALKSPGAWSLAVAVAVIVAASPSVGLVGGVGLVLFGAADTGGSAVQAGLGVGPESWGWLQRMADSEASWVFVIAPVLGWLVDVAKRGGSGG